MRSRGTRGRVDTQGDGSFAAFTRASDAIAAARDAQAALAATPVRARMGIHTGEPILTREGSVGIDVHKGARVVAAGHGDRSSSRSRRHGSPATTICATSVRTA
jgi:class 3 adenylate cyclase